MIRAATAFAVCLLTAACVPNPGSGPAPSSATSQPNPATNAAVAPARAFAVFADVCGGSLPDFASATSRMAAAGVTNAASTGTIYSATEDLSFRILPGPGAGQTCSMVFGTTAPASAVTSTAGTLGSFRPTPLGNAALFEDSRAIVLFPAALSSQGGRDYYNIRMLSER